MRTDDFLNLVGLLKHWQLIYLVSFFFTSCDVQPYHDIEITFQNPHDGVKLAGNLTVPNSPGVHPAVLLIPGGGQMNRDEACFGHRPFKVLADYLARRGIISLRVDRRGCGQSEGTTEKFDIEDLIVDAQAGISYLKTCRQTDIKHIGILGHSLGSIIAPAVANRTADVTFLVLIASPGIWGKEFFCMQAQSIARAAGFAEKDCDNIRTLYNQLFPLLIKDKISHKEEETAKQLLEQLLMYEDWETRRLVGDESAEEKLETLRSDGVREFLNYDVAAEFSKLRCSVLALNGDRDIQVPSKENLSLIEKSLRSGGNKDFKIVELPGLNHMLQECRTGQITEYGEIKQTISPKALELIGNWIVNTVKQKKSESVN